MDGSPLNSNKYKASAMKKTLILIFLSLFPLSAFSQNDGEDISIGKYHVIPSKALAENRRILVHLPLEYESTKLDYPVVYHLYGDEVMTYFMGIFAVIFYLFKWRYFCFFVGDVVFKAAELVFRIGINAIPYFFQLGFDSSNESSFEILIR